jgi:hypothetical protein
MEALDFEDETFDYTIIPVALHHVQLVYRGVYEAVRISRKGAILIEPYDSWLARIATRLGLATEYEIAGNYVFRVSIKEMVKVGKAMFTMVHTKPYMCIHYTAKSAIDFSVWRGLNMIADLVAPWAANECIVYFRKEVRLGPKNVESILSTGLNGRANWHCIRYVMRLAHARYPDGQLPIWGQLGGPRPCRLDSLLDAIKGSAASQNPRSQKVQRNCPLC